MALLYGSEEDPSKVVRTYLWKLFVFTSDILLTFIIKIFLLSENLFLWF